MDFSSFNLQDTGDLFKQNYQLNQNNNSNNNNQHHNTNNHAQNENNNVDNSNDFFNFMDSSHNNNSNAGNVTPHFDGGNNNSNQQQHQLQRAAAYQGGVPQLSPDGHEGSFTNSSVLSGHNPEFQMSPLQIATHPSNSLMQQTYHTPLQHPLSNNTHHHLEDFNDEEVSFWSRLD
jgi:hypothetical protein